MLTESENTWLKTRDKKRPYCFYCEALFGTDSCYWKCVTESCAMYPDMKDAAIFEARVAAKLATLLDESYFHIDTGSYESCREVCPAHSLCPKGFNPDCRTTFVKYARLAVEEEMNADRK